MPSEGMFRSTKVAMALAQESIHPWAALIGGARSRRYMLGWLCGATLGQNLQQYTGTGKCKNPRPEP